MKPLKTPIGKKISEIYAALYLHFSRKKEKRQRPVDDPESLRHFLNTRASHVAQTSLFGYLRTRTGMRYFELFSDDVFADSLNIAKWQLWLACLSDLSAYAGGLISQRTSIEQSVLRELMINTLAAILAETGIPADAGPAFREAAEQVRKRINSLDWTRVADDESIFSESPPALVRWAPIIDELKQRDEAIVINSVRFRWQEVRREFRTVLAADTLIGKL